MKIKTMYATFGKLEEAQIDLSEGLNVLYGANESGKSTWSAFLRVMLYGISTRERSTATLLADKEKYAPWSGKPMYGKIQFIWQGKDYVMERVAGKNGILQDAKIWEEGTGKVLDIPEPVGETLLGIRREVFERTAFIAQNQLAISADKTGEFEKRICALTTSGEEDVSQNQVIERLKKERRVLRNYKKGLIPDLEEELSEIAETISEARRELDALTAIHGEIEELRRKEEEAARDIEVAKVTEARRYLGYILTEEEKLLDAEKELETHRAGITITLNQIEQINQKQKQFEETDRKYTECSARLESVQGKEETVVPEGPGAKPFVIASICAGITLVSAVFIKWFAILAAVCVFIAVFFALRTMMYKKIGVKSKKELEFKKNEVLKRIQTIEILREECNRAKDERDRSEENLKSVLNMLGSEYTVYDVPRIISEARAILTKEKELEQKVSTLKTKCEALKLGRDVEELKAVAAKEVAEGETHLSEEELRAIIATSAAQRERSTMQMAAMEERIRARGELGALQVKKQEIEEELADKNRDYEALGVACDLLAEIQNELARKFAPSVEKRAGEIFEYLTGEHFKIVRIENAEMEMRVAENIASPSRSILELSGGTLDELYISVRLALVEEMLEKDVPILLDDAMVNFDDKRMARTLEFLEKLSKERQIMVLTCHSREKEFAKSKNITSVEL